MEQSSYKITQFSNRISSLDLARFLAMFFMIQGHVIFALASPDSLDVNIFPWNIWNFLRGLTAPIFLMVSGAVHVFANKREKDGTIKNSTLIKRIRTSIMLLALGYFLAFPPFNIFSLQSIESRFWAEFFKVNILHIFGISLLILTIYLKFSKNDKQLMAISLATALIITILTPYLNGVQWNNYTHDLIGNYLTFAKGSLFTIFPYTAYLFYGVTLGLILKRITKVDRNEILLKYGIPVGMFFLFIGIPLYNMFVPMTINLVYKSNPGVVLINVGLVLFVISFAALIHRKFHRFESVYSLFSKRAIVIYVVHLVLIYGMPIAPSLNSLYGGRLDITASVIAAVGVILATLISTYYIDRSLSKYPVFTQVYRYSFGMLLLYILFV